MLLSLWLWPAAALAQATATLEASFVGTNADQVGRGNDGKANGEKDGQFRVVLDVGNDTRTVRYVVMHAADANGQPTGEQVWDTAPNGYWILGVERDGRRLNPRDADIADQVWGKVTYNVYANGSGLFTPDRHFLLLVRFQDGTEVSAQARVEQAVAGGAVSAGSRFTARWEMVNGTWTSEWRRDMERASCELASECKCRNHNFCGEHNNGEMVFWWRDGCDKKAVIIRCNSKPQE
jgi:hypothetical protein